jgi:polysaccharide export outer membrane protein
MNALISLLLATMLMQRGTTPIAPPRPAPAAPAAAAQQPAAAPAEAPYQIGPGDMLRITTLDEAELTGNFRVDTDGSFTFPYLNRVTVAGLTIAEVTDKIKKGLAEGYIRNPQVRVEIESYKSQSVMVGGEVRQPNKIQLQGTMTVLEALAQAGSPTTSASSEVTIARKKPGSPEAEVIRVNWKNLQLGKGTDVVLMDGDILTVPKARMFYMNGQVRNSGTFVLEPGMTVQQAIALAGGMTERGSDRRITASRLVKGKLTDVSLKLEDKIEPDDVVTIGQRLF